MAPPRKLAGREAEVVAAYRAGATYREMQVQFGVARTTLERVVREQLGRQRPGRRPVLAGRDREVVRSYRRGRTLAAVAADFGTTKNAVRTILRLAGVEIRRYTPRRPQS